MIDISSAKTAAPMILFIDDAINDCKQIIEKTFEDNNLWRESKVGVGEGSVNQNIRRSWIYDIVPNYSSDIFWFELSQKLWRYGNEYAKKFNIGFEYMENPQILRYESGDGFYVPHVDSGPENPRIFSLILYLNDVEEGGETYFNHFDVSVSPKEGRLAIFPSNYAYLHEARVPRSQDKYVIVTWFKQIV